MNNIDSINGSDNQASQRNSFSQQDSSKTYSQRQQLNLKIWTYVNKYLYSLILLGAATTAQFDFIGLMFFLLFIVHAFAYYSLRIVLGQVLTYIQNSNFMIDYSGQGLLIFQRILEILEMISSEFSSIHTFIYIFIVFMISILLIKTKHYEETYAKAMNTDSKRSIDPIITIEGMRNYQVQKTVQLIKDYKFRNSLMIQLEILILGFITSVSCTVLVLPYIFLFIFMGLIMACSQSQQTIRKVSNKLNVVFIALLLVDLPTKYFLKGSNVLEEHSEKRFIIQAVGLLSSLPSYVEFYLKIFLFLLECQKLQYSYDYDSLYEQIKQVFSEKQELQRIFRKRTSFKQRIFKPISLFLFCTLAILFSLLHPSIMFFALMPLLIFGLFMPQSRFRKPAKLFVFIFGVYIISSCSFNVIELITPESLEKDKYISYFSKIFGLQRDKQLLDKLFPYQYDFFIYIAMACFVKYLNNKQIQENEDLLARQNIDEDILTIPDDVSEVRSKIGAKPILDKDRFLNQSRIRGNEQIEAIQEELKEDDQEEIADYSQIYSVTSIRQGQRKTNYIQQTQPKLLWNVQRDETMRGKLRRWYYKIYLKLKSIFDRILNLTIIHSSKFALLALFCVSVSQPNLFNAMLFLLFLGFSLSSDDGIQRYWRIPIFINSFIIITMYGYDVFAPDGIKGLDKEILLFIGVTTEKQEKMNINKYFPYLILMAILVITQYVLNSQKYQEYKQQYINLQEDEEQLEEGEESYIVIQEKNKVLSYQDPITKFIIKNSIYLLVSALFIECALLPVSILNFVLLLHMTVIVIKYFINNSQIEVYQRLQGTLRILRIVSLIFIFLKYMFQFESFAHSYVMNSNIDAMEYYNQLPLIEKLLGIENSFVPLKLFSLALVLVLSNLQIKFLKQRYMTDILQEEEQEWDRLALMKETKKNRCWKIMHYSKIYFLFAIHHLIIPLPIIMQCVYSYIYLSFLGFVLLTITLAIMYLQRDTFWRHSYKVIGIISSLTLLIIYLLQFVYLNVRLDDEALKWIGVVKQNAQTNIIYNEMVPLFLVLVSCSLQKLSLKCETLFQQTVQESDLQPNEKDQTINQVESIFKHFEDEEQNKLKLKHVYNYEAPIRQCLKFRDIYMRQLFLQFGGIVQIFISLFTMLWKLNLTSLIYLWIFVNILKQNYFPKKYQYNMQVSKRMVVASLLKKQLLIITFVMIFEYFMSIEQNDVIDFITWKQKLASLLCLIKEKECINDWEEWLSLSNFPKNFIIIDFLMLLISYVNVYFVAGNISLQESQLLEPPKINDEGDFYIYNYQNRYFASIYQLIFNGFPYILIASVMVFTTRFHGVGMSDLVSMVYLCLAFYYIINFRRLYTKNTQILIYLRSYNIIVLFLVIAFQAPLFICPAISSNQQDLYINKQECSKILQTSGLEILNYGNEPILAFYIVLTQSIGLFKQSDVLFDLIFIILLTEIQNQIFDHPFFQVYVLQHMKEEKQTDGRLRAFMFVERTHLKTLWSYKAIKEEIKILHIRLIRIMNAIRSSEFSRHLLDEDEEEKHKLISETEEEKSFSSSEHMFGIEDLTQSFVQAQQLQNEKVLDEIVESHKVDIENLALQLLSRPDTPVISLKLFSVAFKSYLATNQQFITELDQMDMENSIEEQLQQIVLKLQKQVHFKNRLNLYNKEGVGLNFAIQKGSSDLLKESDYAFYQHLILSIQPQSDKNDNLEENQKFEVKESYEEFFQIYDQYKQVQRKQSTIFQKLDFYIRSILWTKFINKHLFYSLTQESKNQVTLEKIHFLSLIGNSVLSQSQHICYLMLFINFILNASIISLVFPLSALLYALLDHPVPHVKYWKYLMVYLLTIIGLKFLYQLPIFCGSPPYSLYSIDGCQAQFMGPEVLLTRIDYIIGIHKFAGPASFPYDQGIFHHIIGDLLVLFALLLHKNYLIKVGLWHYVKINYDIQQNPSFKCKPSELSEIERLNTIRSDNYVIYEYDQSNALGKILINIKRFYRWMCAFICKLIPNYLSIKQRNPDLRTQKEMPYLPLNFKRVKPGKDYFSENFLALLLILGFNLFFFRQMTGEDGAAIPSVNFQRFSVTQVGILFLLLCQLMIERMLYRTRQFNSSNSSVQQGLLSRHALTIKLLIHIFAVIITHLEIGFLIPMKNQITLSKKFALVLVYLLFVMYFVFSALQIKHGYPQAPFKPPFTRDTSFLKVTAFRVYKAIPFLWEMKVIIDWTVTATCLDLFQWFKLDDAFNYLYYNQYQNNDRKSRPEFAQRSWSEKFFYGFCFALGLILIILAPILLFSGINPIMVKNPVISASLKLELEMNSNGNSYAILQTQGFNLGQVTDDDLNSLTRQFTPINIQFEANNMQKMFFSPYSENEWSISPPSLQKFIDDFNAYKAQGTGYVEIKSQWQFKRENPIGNEVSTSFSYVKLNIEDFKPIVDLLLNNDQMVNRIINDTSNQQDQQNATGKQDQLVQIQEIGHPGPKIRTQVSTQKLTYLKDLNNKAAAQNKSTIFVQGLFPKMLRLGSTSQAHQLEVIPLKNISYFSSAELTLNKVNNRDLYWTFSISKQDQDGIFAEASSKDQSYDNMVLVVYNEEVIGSLFGSALQLSVVGLYATIVIAIGRFIRLIFDRISQRMIYEEMPDTEKLFEICEGIFIAQLEGDLVKEKRLYDLLIRMYRSPETLIKLTGTKNQYKKQSNLKRQQSAFKEQ